VAPPTTTTGRPRYRLWAIGWPNETIRTLFTEHATTDHNENVRQAVAQAVAQRWLDEQASR
jgi:hypothetical protein